MPLIHEITKRKHRAGHPVQTVTHHHYLYGLDEASKDLIREAARREGLRNYSSAPIEDMRHFLREHHVSNIMFRIIKKH
jgi:hypothetical protein